MTLRDVAAVSGLLAVLAVTPVAGDAAKVPVVVSAQVVRSCRVAADHPQVSVDCGTLPATVQVSADGADPVHRTVVNQTAVSPAAVRTVTIHF